LDDKIWEEDKCYEGNGSEKYLAEKMTTIYGGIENDTYIFGRGDGNDTIEEWGGNSIVKLKDVNSSDATITKSFGFNTWKYKRWTYYQCLKVESGKINIWN